MFSIWSYEHLNPHVASRRVAHPLRLRAIAPAKKKNDRIDASKTSDGPRYDFLPECYRAPAAIRESRLYCGSYVPSTRHCGTTPSSEDIVCFRKLVLPAS
jgi:hypothetical protein